MECVKFVIKTQNRHPPSKNHPFCMLSVIDKQNRGPLIRAGALAVAGCSSGGYA